MRNGAMRGSDCHHCGDRERALRCLFCAAQVCLRPAVLGGACVAWQSAQEFLVKMLELLFLGGGIRSLLCVYLVCWSRVHIGLVLRLLTLAESAKAQARLCE